MSNSLIEFIGIQLKVPEHQLPIFRSVIKNEPCDFYEELKEVDGLLKSGDLLLMTGIAPRSKLLLKGQQLLYKNAKSTHIAIVHADYVCIDAIPDFDTTNRLISEVLTDVEEDWRVIRFSGLSNVDDEPLYNSCVFYLYQPYKILPSRKPAKNFSYCSELARKIYFKAGIKNTGIASNLIIKPSDFDKLADKNNQWCDITNQVRPAITFCRKYEGILRFITRAFIDGLKLNRKRFNERSDFIKKIKKDKLRGVITAEVAQEMIDYIESINMKMNHKFWDVSRK